MNLQIKKQVRNLILLLGSSLFCAGLAVVFLLIQYGQKDEIQIKKTLINPEILAEFMTYQIDLVYFDASQGSWFSNAISIEKYKKIFEVIARDKSIKNLSSEEIELFSNHFSTRLIVQAEYKKQHSSLKHRENHISQEVEFTSAGTYRIVTFTETRPSWVYFRHSEIGAKILNLQ
jgi:hypothetical protein